MNFGHRKADGRKIYDCIETDKEKDVFWKAWRKNVNSIWK